MARLNYFKLLLLTILIPLQSCNITGGTFDKNGAGTIVKLDNRDLKNFLKLRQLLVRDLPALKRIDEKQHTLAYNKAWKYLTTNTYYLNQVDSLAYSGVLSQLKDKYYNDFLITDSGKVVFWLKRNVNMKIGDYNDSYEHLLMSSNCPRSVLAAPDTLYIDSTINTDWRYVFARYHTGH